MRIRNNTNGDLSFTFMDGHSVDLSRGEASQELTQAEMIDPYLSKGLKRGIIVPYMEPAKPKPEKKALETKPVSRKKGLLSPFKVKSSGARKKKTSRLETEADSGLD